LEERGGEQKEESREEGKKRSAIDLGEQGSEDLGGRTAGNEQRTKRPYCEDVAEQERL
jgi:hypothetical protein